VARGDGLSQANRPILITSAAGFIGAAVAERLLQRFVAWVREQPQFVIG
jgi:nucleoside-diphosphate-sugar epimerase